MYDKLLYLHSFPVYIVTYKMKRFKVANSVVQLFKHHLGYMDRTKHMQARLHT